MSMTAQELTFHMHTPQANRAMDGKQAAKQHKQRQQTNRPAPYPSPSKRQGGGYQHRRHNSVADALTLGSATAQSPVNSNASVSTVRAMNGLGIKVNGDEQNHNHPTTADGGIDMEYWGIMNDQRPRTPTCQGILSKSTTAGWSWIITRLHGSISFQPSHSTKPIHLLPAEQCFNPA